MALPTHIAFIPDGNRRWARAKGLPVYFGHREGAKVFEKIMESALEKGIPYITIWGASVGNLTKRENREVLFLFKVFESYFKRLIKSKKIHKNEVRIEVLGDWKLYVPKSLQKAIVEAKAATKTYTKHTLTLLIAYSGEEEMLGAVKAIVASGLKASDITKETIKQNLFTKDLPSVDLVIRTGAEPHNSAGFMMWDTAESQLYFSKNNWPAFTEKEFYTVLSAFDKTERRHGS